MVAPLVLPTSTDDLANHLQIAHWAQSAFFAREDSTHSRQIAADSVAYLVQAAATAPALALGAAMVLYSYFWWEGAHTNDLNMPAVREASVLFRRSIEHAGCDDLQLPESLFLQRQCHTRWRHLLLLSAELGRDLAAERRDVRRSAAVLREAAADLSWARGLPFFSGRGWRKPHDTSFNEDHFPRLWRGPLWASSDVPLAGFLEAHYRDFLADLERVLPGFAALHAANANAGSHYQEFGPRDDDWQTIYFLRGGAWNAAACAAAPRACELLRSRPEVAECPLGGAGFLRLSPGGRVKPHFGAGPRLAAHLGLIVPEAGEIRLTVGGQQVAWQAGRALVFDDTFAHSVRHDGVEPRYVLNVWFSHPCDLEQHKPPLPDYCAEPRGTK